MNANREKLAALKPMEWLALTVALAQVRRDEIVHPNVATICILALARITGKYDWTADKANEEALMPEYELRLRFTAASDFQAWRLGSAWAETCAAEYGTRYAGLVRISEESLQDPRKDYKNGDAAEYDGRWCAVHMEWLAHCELRDWGCKGSGNSRENPEKEASS